MDRLYIKDIFYEHDIELVLNCDAIDIEKLILDEHGFRIDQREADATMIHVSGYGKSKRYIWLRKFNFTIPEQGLLFHEVFHLVCDILSDLGMKLSSDSEEAYAYYGQMIYMQCLDELNKMLKFKKEN